MPGPRGLIRGKPGASVSSVMTMDGTPDTIHDRCARCQRREQILNAYAEDVARADVRIADLEAERDTYRELCALLIERAARLQLACWAQRIALDERSRQDGNYSQDHAANQYIESIASGAHVERPRVVKPLMTEHHRRHGADVASITVGKLAQLSQFQRRGHEPRTMGTGRHHRAGG